MHTLKLGTGGIYYSPAVTRHIWAYCFFSFGLFGELKIQTNNRKKFNMLSLEKKKVPSEIEMEIFHEKPAKNHWKDSHCYLEA